MSFQLPVKRTDMASEGIRWSGAAVLVEAMLLLVFLIASLAVLIQLFAFAVNRAHESEQLTTAVAAASDVAERFAANPSQASGTVSVDGLLVVCDVKPESRETGTLYHAEISVYDTGTEANMDIGSIETSVASPTTEPVYTINTSRYESEVS